jgi:hypothetical protein
MVKQLILLLPLVIRFKLGTGMRGKFAQLRSTPVKWNMLTGIPLSFPLVSHCIDGVSYWFSQVATPPGPTSLPGGLIV